MPTAKRPAVSSAVPAIRSPLASIRLVGIVVVVRATVPVASGNVIVRSAVALVAAMKVS